MKNILVTGGAGYIGAKLVPALLAEEYKVKVLDLFIYGEDVFDRIADKKNLECIKGDMRNQALLDKYLSDIDTVIHLACLSNDPSFELNPALGKSINLDAFRPLVKLSIKNGVSRFIYASSSSVYGIKEGENVTEDMCLNPLTDYSKYKAMCEDILHEYKSPSFTTCVVRPATACGYSPRQRLDLAVNILTNFAYHKGEITIFGGEQRRPNIHIEDMIRAYLHILKQPDEKISGEVFNIGYENHKIKELAHIVKEVVGSQVKLITTPTKDNRSYHISSQKIKRKLNFSPSYTIKKAIQDLIDAFEQGKVPDALTNDRYYNIRTMQALKLKE